ncbi:hypothetical protein FACS1894162_8680 [Bacteroidia bacterium]|nr:hypothetical protein FACS1894162_8680 [Bacteroidia bacterium]
MESIVNQIESKINQKGRGTLFFARDFAALGTSDAVRKALQRIEKSGLIVRVAYGIYCYPKLNTLKFIDDKYSLPTIEEIAYAIANRDKIRIVPTASYALNALGLSTQVPMNIVFITDGASRKINIGKGRGILFKHTSEIRNLSYKSDLLMLINSALREIGEGKVTPEQKDIIKEKMKFVSQKELENDLKLMPIWVRDFVLKL